VVLVSRALAYALVPSSPAAARLTGELGGPTPALITVLALALAVAFGAAILWLGSVGAAERALSAGARRPDRLRLRPVLARALSLTVASALVFAGVESYIHYRQGLGFHALHCLLGPVHRDVLPILAALSLRAAALHAAASHFLCAVDRAAGRLLGARAPALAGRSPVALAVAPTARPRRSALALICAASPRGPPAVVGFSS
jgi:hypothetical protein